MESLAKQRVRRYIISARKKARPQRGRSWVGLGRVERCFPPPWAVWRGTIEAKTVRDAWGLLVGCRFDAFGSWWGLMGGCYTRTIANVMR